MTNSEEIQNNQQRALSVVLVDDHSLCRKGLADLLTQRAGMNVVATTGDSTKVVPLLREHDPDLVVLDLRMPLKDGLSVLQEINAQGLTTPVVILTMSDAQDDVATALQAGARGYLLKDMEPEDVIDCISRAAHGEFVVAPALTLKLAQMLAYSSRNVQEPKNDLASLTKRERQILEHLSCGESNKIIARHLNISHDTVKLHVRHILNKLNLSSRVEAAVLAVEQRNAPSHETHPINPIPRAPAR